MNLQDICVPKDSDAPGSASSTTHNFDSILSNSLSSSKTTSLSNNSESTKSDLIHSEANSLTSSSKAKRDQQLEIQKKLDIEKQPADLPILKTTDPNIDTEKDMSVVTPFLVKHISDQTMIPKDNFHRYCYRHNPDVICNKRTDEAKMKKIQQQLEKLPSRDQEAISHVWSIFSAAPDHHRSLILQGILTQCCFPQLSFISQEVSSLIRIDFISTLPMEISLKILCYLDCASLCNAAQVSRKWKSLADDDRVWHHMCEQHIDRKCPNCGWGLPLMHMKRAREAPIRPEDHTAQQSQPSQQNQQPQPQQPHNQQPGASSSSSNDHNDNDHALKKRKVEGTSSEVEDEINRLKSKQQVQQKTVLKKRPWKSVYSERFKLEKNWRKGIYKISHFNSHTDGVTCLQFNRKYLMTGSYDATIKIWRVDTGECLRTLTGHTKGVKSLVFDSQKLITGGLDSTIKVWNYHTGQCISTYRGHDDSVSSVDFLNKTIVSGSMDNTVKVWHVDSRTCYTLRGHTDGVNSVKIHLLSNTVFSASDDTTIRMWDLNTNNCLRIFGGIDNNGHIGQVQCVIPLIYKDKLIEDDNESDSEINHWDHQQQQHHHQPQQNQPQSNNDFSSVNNADLPENPNYPTHLLTSSLDNTIKVWDVKTGKCVRTQFGHIEGVWSISADTFRIISGAHDRLVKVWDLQNGKCLHTFGNNASVGCVGLSDSSFVTGLDNGCVKMYSFE